MFDSSAKAGLPIASSVLLAGLGLVVGAAGVIAAEGPGLSAMMAGPSQAAPAPCPTEDDLQERIDRVLDDALVAGKRQQVEALRAGWVQGVAQPWPSAPPDAMTTEASTAAVEAALAKSKASLYRARCDEFPCLFTVHGPGKAAGQGWRIRFEERLEKAGYTLAPKGRVRVFKDPDESLYVLNLWVGDAPDAAVRQRVDYRASIELTEAWHALHPTEGG